MQWWTEFVNWLSSNNGERLVTTAIVPFVAIVVAGIVAALIGRASARKVIELSERAVRASAVTALISAARKAAVWNSLAAPEQQHVDHLISDAEIRLRLLPVAGTSLAADWAAHEMAGMKRNAVSFSFQAEQSLLIFRDRLIEWQSRPGRAKKLFKNDLEAWAYDSSVTEQELVHQQQAWAASQVSESTAKAASSSTPALAVPVAAAIAEPVVTPVAVVPSIALAPPVTTPTRPSVESILAPIGLGSIGTNTVVNDTPADSSTTVLPSLVEPEEISTRNTHHATAESNGDSSDEPTEYLAHSEDEETDDHENHSQDSHQATHADTDHSGPSTGEYAHSNRSDDEHR